MALGFFVWLEGRCGPSLPPRLLAPSICRVLRPGSFVVGFAMLGALTFVPIYLGYVDGASATASGLRTLPMVIGLVLIALDRTGLVGRTGQLQDLSRSWMALDGGCVPADVADGRVTPPGCCNRRTWSS